MMAARQEKLAGYAPQIALYRLAVSRSTGLPAGKIEAKLRLHASRNLCCGVSTALRTVHTRRKMPRR